MIPRRHVLSLLFCAFSLTPLHAAAPSHEHAHAHDHGRAPQALTLDNGKKWASDAPLRQRMANLRAAFAEQVPAIHKGSLPAAGYKALGEKTEAEIAGIVAECKLAPKADAMLHLIITDMLAGADIMTGKTPGKPAAGAHRVVTALNQYGRHFEHPGWQPLP